MSTTEGSSGSRSPSGPRATRPRPGALYTPRWWERRFPWMLDLLAALDPAPLGRVLVVPLLPARWLIEAASRPLAALLDGIGHGVAAVWSGGQRAIGAAVAALPLPGFVRRSLWLPVRAGDAYPLGAQLALRRQDSVTRPVGLLAAVGAHALLLIYSPTFGVTDLRTLAEELVAIELPPEVQIPPPPQQIARPAAPVIAASDIDEDITIAPTTFDDYVADDLPPPPSPATDEVRQPTFTPFEVAPRILNADLLEELMAQEYPPLLREAGIGGTVVVWAFIGRNGLVEEARVAESSGYPAMDEAALNVARRIRTSPALNRDVEVAVWVQLPFEFEVR